MHLSGVSVNSTIYICIYTPKCVRTHTYTRAYRAYACYACVCMYMYAHVCACVSRLRALYVYACMRARVLRTRAIRLSKSLKILKSSQIFLKKFEQILDFFMILRVFCSLNARVRACMHASAWRARVLHIHVRVHVCACTRIRVRMCIARSRVVRMCVYMCARVTREHVCARVRERIARERVVCVYIRVYTRAHVARVRDKSLKILKI